MGNPTSLLDLAFSELKVLLTRRWKNYLWYILLNAVLFHFAGFFIFKFLIFNFASIQNFITSNFDFNYFPYFAVGITALVTFLLFAVNSLLNFGFHRVAVNLNIDQSPKMILIKGAEAFPKTFFSTIAASILIFGSFILAMVFIGLIAYLSQVSGFAVVLFIGLFLTFVYWLFRLMYFWYLIILEGEGPVEALKNSSSLVKGRWWSVFGVFLLFAVSYAVLSFVGDVILRHTFSLIFEESFKSFSTDFQNLIMTKNLAGIPELLSEIYQLKFIVFSFIQTFIQSFFMIFVYYGGLGLYLALRKTQLTRSKN